MSYNSADIGASCEGGKELGWSLLMYGYHLTEDSDLSTRGLELFQVTLKEV